ncbi:ABC transporter substrate-binding protein [Paenibacillus sp. UNC451MF]|uniref:ABC transporter substrate-binding protein n=1 Tax=Paenibacillus sp. UNC451MF TaxID=1449063 RepID=UPI0004903DAB|nr:extracellular solute-binding protein [Paenibacillus sp. UNC451MF]
MMKPCKTFFIATTVSAIMIAGCSNEKPTPGNTASTTAPSSEPVTIKISMDTTLDEDLMTQIQEQLKKDHPNITVEFIKAVKGTMLQELIIAGQPPDIILTYNGKIASYQDLDILYDMTHLLKQMNVDLGRFDPSILEDSKIGAANDEIYGLPLSLNYHALYYNKDIFDKFGVPYPTDGMTWDQVLQLAKKVTGVDSSGMQIRGFDPGNSVIWVSQPLGIAVVDPKTEKATMNNDQWKKVFEMVKSFYSIPGNEPKGTPKDSFLKDKLLAMYTDLSIINDLELAAANGLNWDMVQYPSYPEKPNIYGNASVNMLMITKTSQHKEQALQVIQTAVSDAVQLESARKGRVTPLKDPKFKTEFGKSRDVLKGKNVQGIFKSKPVKYPVASKYRSKAESMVRDKFTEYMTGKIDVNTALSRLDEEINKMIQGSTQ